MQRLPAGDRKTPTKFADSYLALLGRTQKQCADRWTILEAIAWIGSRDRDVVAGISFCIADTAVRFRPNFPDQPRLAEYVALDYVQDAMRDQFCKCGRPPVHKGAVRKWNALSEEERARAPHEPETYLGDLFEDQAMRHCLCFSTSADELFRALLAAQLVALGYHSGARREIDRPEWINAGFDSLGELHLENAGWTSITIDAKSVQALWPATFTINGNTRTFEDWEIWARSDRGRPTIRKYIQEMFEERVNDGLRLERALDLEADACVDELKRRFGALLEFPEPRSCRDHIKERYVEVVAQQKS